MPCRDRLSKLTIPSLSVSFMKDNNGDFVIQLGDREQIVHSKVLKKCAFFTAAVVRILISITELHPDLRLYPRLVS